MISISIWLEVANAMKVLITDGFGQLGRELLQMVSMVKIL